MGCTLTTCSLLAVVVLLFMVKASSTLGALKGFNFQKEHDGSIIGIEEGIEQITFPGRLSIVLFL